MGESESKNSCKTVELEAYWLEKDNMLLKDSLTERLRGLLRLSGMDSIVKHSLSCQEGLRTIPL